MKWTIGQLHQLQSKDFIINEKIDLSELTKAHSELRDLTLVKVTGRADVSHSKVTFHLNLSGSLVLPCSRTLVDVHYPYSIDTTETFLLKPAEFDSEEDLHHIEGDIVDLTPIIEEILLLEIPMQVFCDNVTEEEGAAPQAGKDWEVISEDDQTTKVDPRLADLAKFFVKED